MMRRTRREKRIRNKGDVDIFGANPSCPCEDGSGFLGIRYKFAHLCFEAKGCLDLRGMARPTSSYVSGLCDLHQTAYTFAYRDALAGTVVKDAKIARFYRSPTRMSTVACASFLSSALFQFPDTSLQILI